MEAMQAAAVSLGLDPGTAGKLVIQTALGAARMANESEIDVAELRARVTSRGGTTAAAISSFEDNGFNINVGKAIDAAYDRSRELADELGRDT
jgi:pyrroline-5-carboxylate reductase